MLEATYSMIIETEEGAHFAVSEIIAYSEDSDLAILKIDGVTNLEPLEVSSKEVQKGDKVVAIGSPEGMQNTVSEGIVSGIRADYIKNYDVIQITAEITHGSSGGALFNQDYKVIGVTFAGKDVANINFAIPIKAVEELYASKNKEFDYIKDLYTINVLKDTTGNTCWLSNMSATNVYSVDEWLRREDNSFEEYVFVYGYYNEIKNYSWLSHGNVYLYADRAMITGDSAVDSEYVKNAGNGVLRINLGYHMRSDRTGKGRWTIIHNNIDMNLGDLVIVCLWQDEGEYKTVEIANTEGTDIL